MTTTSLKSKVSCVSEKNHRELRERLENDKKGDSAKSSFVNAPPDKWKAMSESPLDGIDAEGLEYYLPEMGEDVVDLDTMEVAQPMTAVERKENWIRSFMFAPPEITRGIEGQTQERIDIPDVQQLIIHNEGYQDAPWFLVEHVKELKHLVKNLIRLKKETLQQPLSQAERAVTIADLEYLYTCESRLLKEENTALIYYRRRLKQIEEMQ